MIQIDYDKRSVQIEDRSGFTRKIDAGNNFQNFDQIKPGDTINMNYSESIHIKAFNKNKTKTGYFKGSIFAHTPDWQLPGVVGASSITAVVTVTDIDQTHSLVTLKDSQGHVNIFSPDTSYNLSKLKVGDKIAVTIAESMLLQIEQNS